MPPPAMPGAPYTRAGSVSRDNVRTGAHSVSRTPINPPLVVNVMWMISDFTAESGATRLVPRSHLSGTHPEPAVPHNVPTVVATGKAGTALIWEGRTWHSAGENAGNTTRYGVIIYYGAPQIRSLQNHTMGIKADVLADAAPELLELLGFKVWNEYGKTGNIDTDFAKPADELIGELKP